MADTSIFRASRAYGAASARQTHPMLDRDQLAPHGIARWALAAPASPTLTHAETGASLTYSELHHAALRWAAAFRRAGVSAGTHVATMIPNSAESYIAWLGLAWLRPIEVPLNNAYTGQMLQYTLGRKATRRCSSCIAGSSIVWRQLPVICRSCRRSSLSTIRPTTSRRGLTPLSSGATSPSASHASRVPRRCRAGR